MAALIELDSRDPEKKNQKKKKKKNKKKKKKKNLRRAPACAWLPKGSLDAIGFASEKGLSRRNSDGVEIENFFPPHRKWVVWVMIALEDNV